MKTVSSKYLVGGALIALALSGCGRAGNTAGSDASANSEAAVATATDRPTAGRAIAITANDTMKFNTTEIDATPGEALAVTLTNTGRTPKYSMGHDWVLLQPDTDLNHFVTDGLTAAATNYIADSDRGKVIANTKLLGPNESDTALFYAPKTPGKYPFICTFPGHMQLGMKGCLIVK
ncbi:MAG: plastocyanin/azurin family copper-binding protein [Opitutaceae bacterium]